MMKMMSLRSLKLYFWLLVFVTVLAPSAVFGLGLKFSPHGATDKCLTVANGATGDGLVYSMLPCDGSNWQRFVQDTASTDRVIQFQSLHTYSSCNPQCVDVVEGSGPQRVIQQPCNRFDRSQMWLPTPAPVATTDYQWLKNLNNGLCMTAENLFGGDYVDSFACSTGALHQNWKLEFGAGSAGNNVLVKNQLLALTTPCLTVDLGSPYAGASMSSKACSPTAGYYQTYYTNIYIAYLYKNLGSGKCMDGGSTPQTPFQYTCTPAAYNHQWISIQYPDEIAGGNYAKYMFELYSGLCLTWDPTAAPTNLQMTTCVKGAVNQQWDVQFWST